jgi:hypothetical protein
MNLIKASLPSVSLFVIIISIIVTKLVTKILILILNWKKKKIPKIH